MLFTVNKGRILRDTTHTICFMALPGDFKFALRYAKGKEKVVCVLIGSKPLVSKDG